MSSRPTSRPRSLAPWLVLGRGLALTDARAHAVQAPFGQLPILTSDLGVIAQSMAIFRVLARQARLDCADDLRAFAVSEMLIEESVDIYNIISKAHYAADKKAAWAQAIDVLIPRQLQYLEALLARAGSVCFTGRAVSAWGLLISVCLMQAHGLTLGTVVVGGAGRGR